MEEKVKKKKESQICWQSSENQIKTHFFDRVKRKDNFEPCPVDTHTHTHSDGCPEHVNWIEIEKKRERNESLKWKQKT